MSPLVVADPEKFEDLSRFSDSCIDEGIAAAAFLTDLARWNLGQGGGGQDGYRKWTNTPYADDVDFVDVAKPTSGQVSAALSVVQKVQRHMTRYADGDRFGWIREYKAMLQALEKDLTEIVEKYGD